jgi:hypothetical protein
VNDGQGLVKQLDDTKIKYVVCSGSDADELLVEKMVYVVAAGISIFPPLS